MESNVVILSLDKYEEIRRSSLQSRNRSVRHRRKISIRNSR